MARALPEVVTVPPVSVEGTATSQVGIMVDGWWGGCGCGYVGMWVWVGWVVGVAILGGGSLYRGGGDKRFPGIPGPCAKPIHTKGH